MISLDEKIKLCCASALEKKAEDLITLNLEGHSSVADYFMICSGSSTVQVQAIADEIIEKLKKNKVQNSGVEGYAHGRWILIDFFDLVVHVFHEETREFYGLERLWGDLEKEQ